MKKRDVVFLCIFGFFVFNSLLSFAQEAEKVTPFIPGLQPASQPTEEDFFEENVQSKIKALQAHYFYGFLMGYQAIRDESLAVCKSVSSPEAATVCKGIANEYMGDRYLSEGRCDKLKNADDKKICVALSEGNCASLSGPDQDTCYAYERGDLKLLIKAFGAKNKKEMSLENASILLSLVSGYRHYSVPACERFARNLPLSRSLSCEILFSSEREPVEMILRDVALLWISKDNKDESICAKINIKAIKNCCHNPSIKTIDEFLLDDPILGR